MAPITQASSDIPSVSAMELRGNPGSIIDRVFYRNESVLITRAGKPKVAIVPLPLLRMIEQARLRFFTANDGIQRAFSSESPRAIETNIQKAISEVRGVSRDSSEKTSGFCQRTLEPVDENSATNW